MGLGDVVSDGMHSIIADLCAYDYYRKEPNENTIEMLAVMLKTMQELDGFGNVQPMQVYRKQVKRFIREEINENYGPE